MKRIFWLISIISLFAAIAGCQTKDKTGPKEVLEKYFNSAIRQDYAATYACYYGPYTAKVSKEDFIKHRKEASVLQSYRILSLKQDNDNAAHATVELAFAPSEKLDRKEAAMIRVKEDLIKEGSDWKIKVW